MSLHTQKAIDKGEKKCRRRKKAVYKALVKQIEFYFSDSNIAKSNFMNKKLAEGPWISLDIFMTFNKILNILNSFFGDAKLSDLVKALSVVKSDIVTLNEEKNMIRRVTEIVAMDNVDDCTIYVENFPIPHSLVTIDAIKHQFEAFGEVTYVSLPRFKHNGAIKGFAFVEFRKEEFAIRALESMSGHHDVVEPEKLSSILAFQVENAINQGLTVENNLINPESNNSSCSEPPHKKAKITNEEKIEENYVNMSETAMRIMSKCEWKKLRNSYLNAQRKMMSESKKRVREWRNHQQFDKGNKTEEIDNRKGRSDIPFVAGVIVRCETNENILYDGPIKRLVRDATEDATVAYIDVKSGQNEFYVRCSDPDGAQHLAKILPSCMEAIVSASVLQGGAEKEYWSTIQANRCSKRKKLERGRDRVIRKAEAMATSFKYEVKNKHIIFDEVSNNVEEELEEIETARHP